MTTPESPQFGRESEREAVILTVSRLNERMSSGASVYEPEPLELIRSLPRPICLDFNNVLANNMYPIVTNPEAKDLVENLRGIGTIVIVTSATSWNGVKKHLENADLWHEDMVLLTRYNYSKHEFDFRNEDDLRMRETREDFIRFSKSHGRSFKNNQFPANLKRIAPIFKKPFDVPIIDNESMITSDNPGMLGIQTWAFEPQNKEYEEATRKTGVSFPTVVQIVRRHYSYYEGLENTPFRNALVRASFDKGVKDRTIMQFADNPEVVVRVDRFYKDIFSGMVVGEISPEEKRIAYLNAWRTYEMLSKQYGLSVVKHELVVGPNSQDPSKLIFYTFSELIHGQNLKLKNYSEKEKQIVAPQLEQLYMSLADYLWDIYQNGGFVVDLFDFERGGNAQFVFGRRKGDEEDKVWLVDVDGKGEFLGKNNKQIMTLFSAFSEMIEESEGKLEAKLTLSRQRIIEKLKLITEEDGLYRQAIFARRKLQDPTAGTDEEDKLELQKALDEFLSTQPEIRFTRKDFMAALSKHFDDGHALRQYFQGRRSNIEFDQFNLRDYSPLTEIEFQRECTLTLTRRLYDKGRKKFTDVERRYGSMHRFIFDYLETHAKEKISDRLAKERGIYEEAKAKSDQIAIKEEGWEDDVLRHFFYIYDIFGLNWQDKFLNEYKDYYIRLACEQQGISYPLAIKTEDVIERFNQDAAKAKRPSRSTQFTPDNFYRYVLPAVREHIARGLSEKFSELEKRYRKGDIDILKNILVEMETKRIIAEAFPTSEK